MDVVEVTLDADFHVPVKAEGHLVDANGDLNYLAVSQEICNLRIGQAS